MALHDALSLLSTCTSLGDNVGLSIQPSLPTKWTCEECLLCWNLRLHYLHSSSPSHTLHLVCSLGRHSYIESDRSNILRCFRHIVPFPVNTHARAIGRYARTIIAGVLHAALTLGALQPSQRSAGFRTLAVSWAIRSYEGVADVFRDPHTLRVLWIWTHASVGFGSAELLAFTRTPC